MEKTIVRQAVPLQPMEDDWEQISTCTHAGPHARADGCPKESVILSEAWGAGTGSWQDLWPHGERSPHWSRFAGRTCDPVGDPTLEQSAPEGLHPVEGTHAGAAHEELQPMGRTHSGEVGGGLSTVGGTPCWSRGRV
ncbi:zinc finger and BTB domain-containing protein 5 [Grus japonensis]|uniref:Zinc finger and BTB domain-containing protein 5 n=1 Tax=Grus japonensis TaxID=30415 RepID=A0ABC9WKZ8_GRUJA